MGRDRRGQLRCLVRTHHLVYCCRGQRCNRLFHTHWFADQAAGHRDSSSWLSEVDRRGRASRRGLEERVEQRSRVDVLEVRRSGLAVRLGGALALLALLRARMAGCGRTWTSKGRLVGMLRCLGSHRGMDRLEGGGRRCRCGGCLGLWEVVACLERLHSCHSPGEVGLAREIGLCNFVALVKVLLEKAIALVVNRGGCELAHTLVNEVRGNRRDWLGLDALEEKIVLKYC